MPAPLPISPAATVLLLRDAAQGLEILLVQRASELAFHGGAWVFPGGRVEQAELEAFDPREAARRAAVRETQEEAGILLEPERLVPFSHWTTPEGRPRRFATWFFWGEVDPQREVVVDGGEIKAHRWQSPAAALAAQAAGEIDLPAPTYVSLAVLADCRCVADVSTLTRASAPPVFVPRPRTVEQGVISLYEGDVAYHGGELEVPGPRHRLVMLRSGYRYLRSE
jgi:8-oxo-dGTP pyrophosphatase MutT (NUDIX family)